MARWGGIRGRLVLMAALPVLTFLVLAALAASTFNQVRVLGDNYNQIIRAKDLVADVLPPPAYIVESYLTVLALTDPNSADDRAGSIARLERLEREYRERRAVWDLELTDPATRETLLEDSYQPADRFFVAVNEEFIPLVEAGDLAGADELANGRLAELYVEHRAAIDRVVLQARTEEDRIEADTAQTVTDRIRLFGVAFVLLLAATAALGFVVVRSILRPITRLREIAGKDLPARIQQVRSADLDGEHTIDPIVVTGTSELDQAAAAFNSVVAAAVDLAGEQARLRRNTATTFVNLGRRNQNLVARQLRFIDEMERSETDPALLKNLFRLDHLATRMRRNAESLLVLAGIETARKWREPVSVLDVARSALGEVEGYERVRLDMRGDALLPGAVIADVSHLLAELFENALRYSPPESLVTVSGGYIDGRFQLTITDQGIGIAPSELQAVNEQLTTVKGFDEAPSASLGFFVVARLAARHGIVVELESEGGEGLSAYVTLPTALLEQAGDLELQAVGRGRHLARTSSQLPTPDHTVARPPTPDLGVAAADHVPVASGSATSLTAAGFRKRQSKLTVVDGRDSREPGARGTQTPATLVAAADRRPDDVRDRYTSFAAGKSRAAVEEDA